MGFKENHRRVFLYPAVKFWTFLLFVSFFTIPANAQDRYGMDFSIPWEWEDLTNTTIVNAREMAPVLEDLRLGMTIVDARILFKELSLLNNLDELKSLSAAALEDNNPNRSLWVEKLESEFSSYSSSDDVAGILDAAVKLMRLRNEMHKTLPRFEGRNYLPQPISSEYNSLTLNISYKSSDEVLTFYEINDATADNASEIINSHPYRVLFETRRTEDINSTQLKDDLWLTKSGNPVYAIYKWLNPMSFSGFGGVSLHTGNYESVLNTLKENEDNINRYAKERVGMYLPDNFPLYAEVFYMVGCGEQAWFNQNGAIGISLEYFGDEYSYIVSYLIHELYSLAEDNIQIPVYEFILNGQDLKFMKLIRDITRVGTANYVGPIGSQNRPSDLLEKDFKLFNSTYSSLYGRNNLVETDSLIKRGFQGVGPFYTMGTQMAYIIENTHGRKALIESIKMGPVYFFKNYIEAYKDAPDEIRKVFRFNDKIEDKIEMFVKIFDENIMEEALKMKSLTITPSTLAVEIDKYIKKFEQKNKPLVNLIAAQLYLEANEYSKAEEYFIKGLEKSSVSTSSEEIGKRFMDRKAYSQAINFFNLFVENSPQNPFAYEIRGECYFKAGDLDNARRDFEKALEIDPDLNVASLYLDRIN
jgi:tetratricopeptide (TPR) repeat protein